MAVIGKVFKVWELPAPQDIPSPKDMPFTINSPEKVKVKA